MSEWPHWLSIRLQSIDGCCWEIKSHWRKLFSKFIFPELFCLTDLLSDILSDLLIVKSNRSNRSPVGKCHTAGILWFELPFEFCLQNKESYFAFIVQAFCVINFCRLIISSRKFFIFDVFIFRMLLQNLYNRSYCIMKMIVINVSLVNETDETDGIYWNNSPFDNMCFMFYQQKKIWQSDWEGNA